MIAEVLLVLAGHSSSLFPSDHTLHPQFAPLLHPGEQQCLESIALIAFRYRNIKSTCSTLSHSSSRYICALCATLNHILKDEYESLVVETEAMVLKRDSSLVASGSFVPLSSIRAIFSPWDAPLASLTTLIHDLQSGRFDKPGPLIDMLLSRSRTGVHRIADIMTRLCNAVQRVWRTQLTAFLVHGTVPIDNPLTSPSFELLEGSVPSCVSNQSRDSIVYVGRAISTVKAAKWQKQLPRTVASEHTALLEATMPDDQHAFDLVISQIRTNVSEWLWSNVLTRRDVEEAVESLANYFLLRNGEFSLSLIREIERLKISKLSTRSGSNSMIREQDLNLAILRASLSTSAQHDPTLTRLRFSLPSGPLRPLLPSLAAAATTTTLNISSNSTSALLSPDPTLFSSHLLGTPLTLNYTVKWPLDLFLHKSDLTAYTTLFSYLSALRKTHTRIHTCWSSLSNSQRARRRWTGLGEGGTVEDLEARSRLLRCAWGVVRDMSWFLDTLLGYLMMDVVDVEFGRLREMLSFGKGEAGVTPSVSASSAQGVGGGGGGGKASRQVSGTHPMTASASASSSSSVPLASGAGAATTPQLDFSTLRTIHATYLDRLLTGCLLTNPLLTSTLKPILEICEAFVAQIERWGGDVLPALLFEGSLTEVGGERKVGKMVNDRWVIVAEINENLRSMLSTFYDHLSASTSQKPFNASSVGDASKSILLNSTIGNFSIYHNLTSKLNGGTGGKGIDGGAVDVRRHVERLLLRLDFNSGFSKPNTAVLAGRAALMHQQQEGVEVNNILKEGGIL